MDIIVFQRIRGGWEFEYSRVGETFRGFDQDIALWPIGLKMNAAGVAACKCNE